MAEFSGTHQVKLIDSSLSDFGTPSNPIYTASGGGAPVLSSVTYTGLNITSVILRDPIPGMRLCVYALSLFIGIGQDCQVTLRSGTAVGNIIFNAFSDGTSTSTLTFSESVVPPNYLFQTTVGQGLAMAVVTTLPLRIAINASYFPM